LNSFSRNNFLDLPGPFPLPYGRGSGGRLRDTGLGSLARDVLDHWDKLWDHDDAYNIIISVVYGEKTIGKIDPFDAIYLLQMMENQFIIEAIGETMY
jgi:hypothetical protein